MGGDLDRYRGNYESKPKTKVVETTETDKARYRYEYKISIIVGELTKCLLIQFL